MDDWFISYGCESVMCCLLIWEGIRRVPSWLYLYAYFWCFCQSESLIIRLALAAVTILCSPCKFRLCQPWLAKVYELMDGWMIDFLLPWCAGCWFGWESSERLSDCPPTFCDSVSLIIINLAAAMIPACFVFLCKSRLRHPPLVLLLPLPLHCLG